MECPRNILLVAIYLRSGNINTKPGIKAIIFRHSRRRRRRRSRSVHIDRMSKKQSRKTQIGKEIEATNKQKMHQILIILPTFPSSKPTVYKPNQLNHETTSNKSSGLFMTHSLAPSPTYLSNRDSCEESPRVWPSKADRTQNVGFNFMSHSSH